MNGVIMCVGKNRVTRLLLAAGNEAGERLERVGGVDAEDIRRSVHGEDLPES